MKKLTIIGALMVLGIVANAATVNWSANAIQNSPDVTVGAGWLVEVYTSSVSYDYAKAVSGDIAAWSSTSTVAAGTTFRAAGSVEDGLVNGTSGTFYAVIYDGASASAAKNYIVSDMVTVSATAAGNPVPLSFGAMTATTAANKFLNSSWQAVPEPTSGLLMLLGMAGLALRRRRA